MIILDIEHIDSTEEIFEIEEELQEAGIADYVYCIHPREKDGYKRYEFKFNKKEDLILARMTVFNLYDDLI